MMWGASLFQMGYPGWIMTVYMIDAIEIALLLAAEVTLVINYRKKNKQ